jgi:hypothetical protein
VTQRLNLTTPPAPAWAATTRLESWTWLIHESPTVTLTGPEAVEVKVMQVDDVVTLTGTRVATEPGEPVVWIGEQDFTLDAAREVLALDAAFGVDVRPALALLDRV